MSFWGELKRRNVFKVGAAYVIVAWLILQAISIIFPMLHLPSWTGTFVTVLLIIGFPVALLFAWAFELTADGIKRTEHVPLDESITHVTGRKLNYVLAGLLIVAVGYIVIDKVFISQKPVETEMTPSAAEQADPATEPEEIPKTIAVLPFDDLSPEKDQEYFVAGLSEEIINCLAQLPELKVTGKTSSFSFKGSNKTVQEIASVLGVEHILEGSVRKAGDDLRITAQLLRAEDGFHLFSKTYDRKLADIFAVQEDIAAAVANELKITLGIDQSIRRLGGTDNVKAYELYLVAQGKWGQSYDEVNRAMESIEAALAIDPEFALAWAAKGLMQTWLAMFMPKKLVPAEKDAALCAAERAIELVPNLSEAYESLGGIKSHRGEWSEAEVVFRKLNELKTASYLGNGSYPVFLTSVGHVRKAFHIYEDARRDDPLNPNFRALYILNMGILGDTERAEEEYEDGRALFGNQWTFGNDFIMMVRLGASDTVSLDEVRFSDPNFEEAKAYLDSPEKGLAKLRVLYTGEDNLSSVGFLFISAWAAHFGDFKFAEDALEKSIEADSGQAMFQWLPVFHEVRQLPRFKKFLREIGLVDYWEKFGWPDLCHKLDNGDFVCD